MSGPISEPIDDPFVTIALESEMYDFVDRINEFEAHLRQSVPEYILVTQSGNPNMGTYWGGVLHNLQITRATLRSQLQPRR